MGAPGVTAGATVGVAAGGRAAVGGGDDPQPDSAKPISSTPARITKPARARITGEALIGPTFFWSTLATSADPVLESAAGNQGDQGQEPDCQGCGRDGRLRGSRPGAPRAQDHAAEPLSLSSFPAIPGRGSWLPRAGWRRCAATPGRPRLCGRRCEGPAGQRRCPGQISGPPPGRPRTPRRRSGCPATRITSSGSRQPHVRTGRSVLDVKPTPER